MISPEHFRRYIKPVYQRLMQPAREAGCAIHMHSDGDVRALVDDLIEGGVQVINLQDLVNGIDWIAQRFAGRVCVDLDIDRPQVFPPLRLKVLALKWVRGRPCDYGRKAPVLAENPIRSRTMVDNLVLGRQTEPSPAFSAPGSVTSITADSKMFIFQPGQGLKAFRSNSPLQTAPLSDG